MRAARQHPVDEARLSFHAFDLLQVNSTDLKPKPPVERRRRLVDLVHGLAEAVPVLYLSDTFTDGDELLVMCAKLRLEGIVSKQLDRPMSGPYARLDQGQVRGLERGEPLAAEVFDKSR